MFSNEDELCIFSNQYGLFCNLYHIRCLIGGNWYLLDPLAPCETEWKKLQRPTNRTRLEKVMAISIRS